MHRIINKYTPKRLSEFEGREVTFLQLKEFVNKYKKGSLLLHGIPGSGKTAAVYALANEMDYEVLEISASDTRKKENLLESVGNASQQMSLFNKGKLILIDDVDSLSSKDRGAAKVILDIIKDSKWPVILTANDPEIEKIKDLKKKSNLLELPSLTYTEIFNVLKKICEKENIAYDENTLKSLARQAGGDMRAAMTDLQVLSILSDKINNLDILTSRDQKEGITNALLLIFKSKKPENVLSAFDNVDVDFDTRRLWLDHNLPKEYSNQALLNAYNALSKSDVFNGRIRRQQHWRFLVHMNSLMTAGISLAKEEKNPEIIEYKRSSRPLKYWFANMRNAKRKAISEKISSKLHVSKRNAFKQFLPLFSTLSKNGYDNSIAAEFDLLEEEVAYLRK